MHEYLYEHANLSTQGMRFLHLALPYFLIVISHAPFVLPAAESIMLVYSSCVSKPALPIVDDCAMRVCVAHIQTLVHVQKAATNLKNMRGSRGGITQAQQLHTGSSAVRSGCSAVTKYHPVNMSPNASTWLTLRDSLMVDASTTDVCLFWKSALHVGVWPPFS